MTSSGTRPDRQRGTTFSPRHDRPVETAQEQRRPRRNSGSGRADEVSTSTKDLSSHGSVKTQCSPVRTPSWSPESGGGETHALARGPQSAANPLVVPRSGPPVSLRAAEPAGSTRPSVRRIRGSAPGRARSACCARQEGLGRPPAACSVRESPRHASHASSAASSPRGCGSAWPHPRRWRRATSWTNVPSRRSADRWVACSPSGVADALLAVGGCRCLARRQGCRSPGGPSAGDRSAGGGPNAPGVQPAKARTSRCRCDWSA